VRSQVARLKNHMSAAATIDAFFAATISARERVVRFVVLKATNVDWKGMALRIGSKISPPKNLSNLGQFPQKIRGKWI